MTDAVDNSGELRRTALYSCHLEAEARMVPFAGFEMPVQYSGVVDEHTAVRTAAGLFDVSHMGEFSVEGAQAEEFLQWLTPNNVGLLVDGQAQYSALLTERGTFVDDLLVYRFSAERFMLVVNASRIAEDFAQIRDALESSGKDVRLTDHSDETALIALQGPESLRILASHVAIDLSAIDNYHFVEAEVAGQQAIVSRTGYTGEDGFELYLDPGSAPDVWRALIESGTGLGLKPAGLGARDTLRLEAGMMLYGQDIDLETTPLEARLSWMVDLDGEDFLGKQALVAQKEAGLEKRVMGFEVVGRGIVRHGHPVLADGEEVGVVTSGSWSPTLEKAIALVRVPQRLSKLGTELSIAVRSRELPGKITKTPFYKRSR
jgi:aminomethyltransferase